MAKFTVLEMVQDILNDMDSDEVNSINDSLEAAQIAQIIKTTYLSMMSNRNWSHTAKAIQLEPSGLTANPTHMYVLDEVKELIPNSVRYNCIDSGETRRKYKQMIWKEPDEFLNILNKRNNDNSDVDIIIDPSGIELLIFNDENPTYYTSFDDYYLVFDAYDSAIESNLQKSKTQARVYTIPDFTIDDSFVPDLPEEAFIALLEEAKSRAQFKLHQTEDIKAEQDSSRQNRWLSRKQWKINGGIKFPNYGRKSRK